MEIGSQSKAKLRGVFVGTGHFAVFQLEAWRELPVEIVGIVGLDSGRLRLLQDRFGISSTAHNLEEAIEALRPDFVDICTSVDSHPELVRTCLARGIPVLCQKPIAPTLLESRQLIAKAYARGAPRLMIHDNWRWQPWYRELHRLLQTGNLGAPISLYQTLRTGDGVGPRPYPQQPYFRTMPRFLVLETGIHYLDTYRFLFGEPVRLACVTHRCNPAIAGEDQAIITLAFTDGPVAVWDANRAAPTDEIRPPVNGQIRLECSEASIEVTPQGDMSLTPRGQTRRKHPYMIPHGYRGGSVRATLAHFIHCLETGEEFETNGRDYLKTTELVFAAYDSAEHGGATIALTA